MLGDTGIGATLTFSGGYAGTIRSIELDEETIPVLDKTDLAATTTRKKAPGALVDAAGFTVVVLANLSTMHTAPPPLAGVIELLTITEPAGTTKLFGGAFIDSRQVGTMENEEGLIESTLHITWTGYDAITETSPGPTWAAV